MESKSFKNFDLNKDLVNDKLAEFILSYENSSEKTKELLHYQSVINISREIIRFNNSKVNKLKDSLIEYLNIVKDIDYTTDTYINNSNDKQIKSLALYKKHIAPAGFYLISKSGFRAGTPVGLYIIIGILIDIIIYNYFSKSIVPIVSILMTIWAIASRNKKRKGNKMFSAFY